MEDEKNLGLKLRKIKKIYSMMKTIIFSDTKCVVYPTITNSLTPTGCPTIQLNSDMNFPQLTQTP